MNVTWLRFVFVLISFIHMHGAVIVLWCIGEGEEVGFSFKMYFQRQGGVKSLDVDGQEGGGEVL